VVAQGEGQKKYVSPKRRQPITVARARCPFRCHSTNPPPLLAVKSCKKRRPVDRDWNKFYSDLVKPGLVTETDGLSDEADDAVRQRLLTAASSVFARQGYEGTKIMDIVREAGLSTGAVYGRFRSKSDLLQAAIVEQAGNVAHLGESGTTRVADLIARMGQVTTGGLSNKESLRLEAFVAARREPEIAQAIVEASAALRVAMQPLVEAAATDGTVAGDIDPEAVIFFVRTIGLGLLLQRAAGLPAPDSEAWGTLVNRVVGSFGDTTKSDQERNQGGPQP
jgi:AcrR family transcriptional regulator